MTTNRFEEYSDDELAGYYSDLHKDVYNFRPMISNKDREGIINGILSIEKHMEKMRSTFAGREELRDEGWDIPETDPKYIEQAKASQQKRVQQWNESAAVWAGEQL